MNFHRLCSFNNQRTTTFKSRNFYRSDGVKDKDIENEKANRLCNHDLDLLVATKAFGMELTNLIFAMFAFQLSSSLKATIRKQVVVVVIENWL